MKNLIGRNIVVYDLEIKKPIEECSRGWNSHDEMGISVGCAYDYRRGKYRVFMDDNLAELVSRLNEDGTLVVAFNQLQFDNKLLRASGYQLKEDRMLLNYDMLAVSREGAGVSAFKKGFKLDDHLKACGLPLKTANSVLAPHMWKNGKIGELVDYCLNDVTQEKALFEYIVEHGKLSSAFYHDYPVRAPLFS